MSNAQVLLLVTKSFCRQWVLQQLAGSDWKVMPSEIKLLCMIKLIHFHVDISKFVLVQNSRLKIRKH